MLACVRAANFGNVRELGDVERVVLARVLIRGAQRGRGQGEFLKFQPGKVRRLIVDVCVRFLETSYLI